MQSGMAARDQSALPGHQVRARVRQPRALRRGVEEPARAGAPTCSRVWQRATSLLCQVTRSALASGSPVRSAAAWRNLPGQAHQRAVGYGSARPVCFARSPGPRSRPAAPCAPPRRGKTCEVNGEPWQLSLAARDQSALPGHQVRANRLAAPCAPPRRGGTCQGRRTNVQSSMAARDQSALPGHQVRARGRQPRALRRGVEEPARLMGNPGS